MNKLIVAIAFTATLLLSSLPTALALPTAESSQLGWVHNPDPDRTGYYVYWTPRNPNLECRDHTTYTDANRIQLPDPNATSVDISVLSIGKLHTLCFALSAYDAADNESEFATKGTGNDWGWTGSIAPSEFLVQ